MRHSRSRPNAAASHAERRAGAAADRECCARIMIVDGDAGSLQRASDALARHGYLVEQAFDAAEAQRILQRTVPNLILADSGLPGIDGLARGRELETDDRLRHVPIIALNAPETSGDGAGAHAAGYDGCIAGPVDTRQLAIQVAAFLVRGASRRSGDPPQL